MIPIILLWLSFLIAVAGVILAIDVARIAAGGVLASFVWWLLAGIIVFTIHHLIEILIPGQIAFVISESFESLTSIFFLIGAITLMRTLRSLI